MMTSGEIDAVIVATPHYFHPPLAIEAFDAGLHVMIEKPAGVFTRDVRQMNQAAQASGCPTTFQRLTSNIDLRQYFKLPIPAWIR